jgi:ABC-type transporter Mla subunit MlaD
MIGEKYVELTPGTRKGKKLQPGEILIGNDPTQLDELIQKGSRIADTVEETVAELQTLANTTNDILLTNKDDLRQVIINLEQTSAHASELARGLNEVVVVNKDSIHQMVTNLEETSREIKAFTTEIKERPWRLFLKPKSKKKKGKSRRI